MSLPRRPLQAIAAALAFVVIAFSPPLAEAARPPGAGIAAVWGGLNQNNYSCVRVRQANLRWADIAPKSAASAPNFQSYDWSALDFALSEAASRGQFVHLNVNPGPPLWVFDTVAQVGFSRGERAPQYWDPAYLAHYKTLITALANKVKSLPPAQRALIICVRVQHNAFDAETSAWTRFDLEEIGSDVQTQMPIVNGGRSGRVGDRSKWILGTGTPFGPDLADIKAGTATYEQDYLQQIIEHYYMEFTTGVLAPPNAISTAIRELSLSNANGYGSLDAAYVNNRFVSFPFTMSLDTGCEARTADGSTLWRFRLEHIKNRARQPGTPGTARALWEDWHQTDFISTGANAPVDGNVEREFYWRQLAKLDANASYSACYGSDLTKWSTGAFPGFTRGVEFFNFYAGLANEPENSPGAWIAFMTAPADPSGSARTKLGFFLDHLNPPASDATNVGPAPNPSTNFYGKQARQFGAAGTADFALASAFAAQLARGGATIKVTWFSAGPAAWTLRARNRATGQLEPVGSSDAATGAWQTTTFANVALAPTGGGTAAAPDLTIQNTAGNAFFHMVEILAPTVAPADTARLVNLSVRGPAGAGADSLIVGFTVAGAGTKLLLLRSVGPGLAPFGVTGTLADPQLRLFNGAGTQINQNDDWGGGPALTAASSAVGAFALAPTSKDAALSVALPTAGYSAQTTGPGATTGTVLVEAYDADPGIPFTRLSNLSARNRVGTGSEILIAGFVVSGPGSKNLLIRAVGPTLSSFGVAGTLSDPRLQLFAGSTLLAENDNWGGTAALAAAFAQTGAFALPAASRDAALIVSVPAGSYSAQVSGINATTGVALVEIYELP